MTKHLVYYKSVMLIICVCSNYNNSVTFKCIAVNISERKSGTERPKKRKKQELVYFSTARGCN